MVAKFKIVLLVLLCTTSTAQFADIPPEHWAEPAVVKLVELGVLTGYPSGEFLGGNNVTRYEISLMLSRLIDATSSAQLNEVWSELTGLSTQIVKLNAEKELITQDLTELAQQLERTESLYADIEARTQNIGRTRDDVTNLSATTETLNDLVTDLGDRLESVNQRLDSLAAFDSEQAQNASALSERYSDLDSRLASAESLLSEGELESRLEEVSNGLLELEEAFKAEVGEAAEPEADQLGRSLISVGAGVLGSSPQITAGLDVATGSVAVEGYVAPEEFSVLTTVDVGGGFSISGRYKQEDANAGFVGIGLAPSAALRFGVMGGLDDALAVLAYAHHMPFEQDSAIPGLDVILGAELAQSEREKFDDLLMQAGVRYTISFPEFYIRPEFAYRRDTRAGYQAYVPGLSAGIVFGETLLNGNVKYGIIQGINGNSSLGLPEIDLSVRLENGAFVRASFESGLPDSFGVASFADANPYLQVSSRLGLEVGVIIELAELW